MTGPSGPTRRCSSVLLAALLAAGAAAQPPEPAESPPPDASGAALAPEPAAAPEDALPDAAALVQRAEQVMRGQGSRVDATMTILKRKRRRTREFALRIFDDRRYDRALVRVLSPQEHAGTALLKLPPNLWRYSPETRETSRIPGASWGESFLGGDFSRDDLVRGSLRMRDYAHRILEVDPHAGEAQDQRAFVVECAALPQARVAWGRIVAWIEAEHATPLRLDFHAADGALVRTLRLADVREVAGRRFPHLWVMRRAGDDRRETRIAVDRIHFDPAFEDGLFTTRRLAQDP